MNKNLKILKMKDDSDKHTTHKDIIPSLPFRLILNMKTGGGKTNIIANLILLPEFYGKDFYGDDIVIVSPVLNDRKMETIIEQKEIPEDNIITEYDEEIINAHYEKMIEEFKERDEGGKKVHNKIFIFDDVSHSGNLRKGSYNIVNKIFCNGRKHLISCIITSQYYFHISPACKSNASALILGSTSDKNLDLISDDHNYIGNRKEFKEMFRNNVKEKHDWIMINYDNPRDDMYLDKEFKRIQTT